MACVARAARLCAFNEDQQSFLTGAARVLGELEREIGWGNSAVAAQNQMTARALELSGLISAHQRGLMAWRMIADDLVRRPLLER